MFAFSAVAGFKSLFKGRGGISSGFCFVHGRLFKGEGEAGSRGALGTASSHCLYGDPWFSSRVGFLSQSSVATCLQSFACREVFT